MPDFRAVERVGVPLSIIVFLRLLLFLIFLQQSYSSTDNKPLPDTSQSIARQSPSPEHPSGTTWDLGGTAGGTQVGPGWDP